MSWVLAIDTSDAEAYAALCSRDLSRVYEAWSSGSNSHNEELSTMVQGLLGQAGVSCEMLEALVCGAGPGSFTGLRIGLGFMKGLAVALRRPLELISSLKAAAYEFCAEKRGSLVCVMSDARRAECFCAVYQDGQELLPPQIVKAGEVEAIVEGLRAGTGCNPEDVVYVGRQGLEIPGVPAAQLRRAAHVAVSLCRLLGDRAAGQTFSLPVLSQAGPQYLRAVAARTIAERCQGEDGRAAGKS